jgi:hypothetical protein
VSTGHSSLTVIEPSIPALSIPSFGVMPVGTAPPRPSIVSPGGVIAPYSPFPSASSSSAPTPSPAATQVPALSLSAPGATVATGTRVSTPSGGGGGGGGAGPTALLGVALAAAFIGVTELRDRRRPA